jgi:hypothetical protein
MIEIGLMSCQLFRVISKLFHFRDPKGFIRAFRNGFAPVKIINDIPLPTFSAAMNCAPQRPSPLLYPLFPCLSSSLMSQQSRAQYNTAVFRFFSSDSLEEQYVLLGGVGWLQWSLQPSQKALFITEMETLPGD